MSNGFFNGVDSVPSSHEIVICPLLRPVYSLPISFYSGTTTFGCADGIKVHVVAAVCLGVKGVESRGELVIAEVSAKQFAGLEI